MIDLIILGQIKISQEEHRQSPGYTKYGASVVLSPWSHGCITFPISVCDNVRKVLSTREAHLGLVSRVFTGVPLHK